MAGASATTASRPLVLRSVDDHHAFHEDAKPGDLTGQLGTRRFNSSNQFSIQMISVLEFTIPTENITNR